MQYRGGALLVVQAGNDCIACVRRTLFLLESASDEKGDGSVEITRIDVVRKGPDDYVSIRYMLPHSVVLPPVEWLQEAVGALRRGPVATSCRIHHYDYRGRWPWPIAGYLEVVVRYLHGQEEHPATAK